MTAKMLVGGCNNNGNKSVVMTLYSDINEIKYNETQYDAIP